MRRSRRVVLIVALGLAAQAVAARAGAELVFFSSGRSLSIRGHREEGATMVLMLRGGGEAACDAALITGFAPDEVPHPEPLDPSTFLFGSGAEPAPYADIVARASAEHGVDPRLVHAVIRVESAYNRGARSTKGAMGLMQLMPATARQYAVDDPYDPESNIQAGTRHLRSLLDRFDLSVALAAYNAGQAAVERYGGIPPYRETREYVTRVLALTQPDRGQ